MANKNNETKSNTQDIIALIMGIFMLTVLCVFPLVYHNFYFDILETKYQFYCVSAIIMIIILVGYGLINGSVFSYFETFNIKKVVKQLNIVDWSLLIFWMANVVSCILCKWPWEAFWGTSGRYNGVFLMTIYMVVYFAVTRFFQLKRWYLDAFLLVGVLVCLFGITDYFQMDLLGFKVNMLDEQKPIYTSTFGNVNTYTVYVGMVLCVAMLLFTLEKEQKRMFWYFGVMALAMLALVWGTSDNAYLTLAALFGFSPLYLFKTKSGMRKYFVSVATLLTVVLFAGWISDIYAEQVIGIDGIFNILVKFKLLPVIVVAFWAIVGAWVAISKKQKGTDELGKLPRCLWMVVIVAVIAVVAFVLYDANIAGNSERYQKISQYVVFNDEWGTDRGYVWKRAWLIYNEVFTLPQKLFGYGSDTFQLVIHQYFPPRGTTVYDSAHNEYLHYLITIGFVGMSAYVIFLVSSVVKMAQNISERPEVAAIMFAIIAYMVQAVVNINLPVVMPIIIQLLAMGMSVKKERKA